MASLAETRHMLLPFGSSHACHRHLAINSGSTKPELTCGLRRRHSGLDETKGRFGLLRVERTSPRQLALGARGGDAIFVRSTISRSSNVQSHSYGKSELNGYALQLPHSGFNNA